MKKPQRLGTGRVVLHAFLFLLSMCFIVPFLLVIMVSVSSEKSILMHGYSLFPKEFSWVGYELVFKQIHIVLQAYGVTIFYSLVGTLLSVLVMTMMAYPLSRSNFKMKAPLSRYILITMIFSGGLVPSYIVYTKYYGLGNSIWIYILSGIVTGSYVIIIRTFFQGIPEALVESAKIDGASELRCFFNIMLPLSKPVIATVSLMVLLTKWNDWYTSLVYIRDANLYSLQYLLTRILNELEYLKRMAEQGMNASNFDTPLESMRFALAIVAAGPMLVVFPFFQKYFTTGLTIGAVKG